ncbi:MAG: elongation factor P hydroxylase [bacterium]|nr:elongation factor P hydroxylase [bacterium]
MADRLEPSAAALEQIFAACFADDYRTVLEGGGDEPLYVPSPEPSSAPHRIVYRADYFASALHEVAHWCLAGAERRSREDYGYWYAPDGRSVDQQAEFERVEARPQALEWIFSEACAFDFHLSADNLEGGVGPSSSFEAAVESARAGFLEDGLPKRAARFRDALREAFG